MRRTNSVVLHRQRFVHAEGDEETKAAIALFEKSLKAYSARKGEESGGVSSDNRSPDSETRRKTERRLSVFRSPIAGSSSVPSPLPRSKTRTRELPAKDLAFIDAHLPHPAKSRAVNRLPVPGNTDFNYKSMYPLRLGGTSGACGEAYPGEAMDSNKRAVLNLLPNEECLSIASKKLQVPLFEGVPLIWSLKPTLGARPEAREGATVCWLGRKLYLFGGVSMTKRSDIRYLSPDTWTWTMVSAQYVPKGRIGHTTVSFRDTLVVYGGWSHYSQRLRMRRCYKKVFVLHIQDEIKWQRYRGSGQVPKARRYHCAATLGSSMLVYGGVDMQNKVLHSLIVYDMDSQAWAKMKLGEGPGPLSNATLATVFHSSLVARTDFSVFAMPKLKIEQIMTNSGFYLFGGVDQEAKLKNDLWILKFVGSGFQWRLVRSKGTPPAPRSDHSTVFIGQRLFVYGGKTDSLENPGGLSMLHVETLTWERIAPSGNVPPGRWSHCAAGLDSTMLLLGGIGYKHFQPADMYILETEQAFANELNLHRHTRQQRILRFV